MWIAGHHLVMVLRNLAFASVSNEVINRTTGISPRLGRNEY
jgi:hypothetical protein